MKKNDLIASVAAATGLSKKDADAAVNAVFSVIEGEVAKGEKVTVTGFGTFERRTRAAREGRNPRTGETIQIPAQQTPAFKAGKAFKDAVK